jgi:hypothetical protein
MMRFRMVTDLASWTTERLMLSLRRQFAYSVGVFFLMLPFLVRGEIRGIIMFSVLEICVGFTFLWHWRELRRRQSRMETDTK